MSYSFTVGARTKDDAKALVEKAFDDVLAQQPIHKADRAAAIAAADALIYLLGDPEEDQDVVVSVNGYVSWRGDMQDADFIGANLTVHARIAKR